MFFRGINLHVDTTTDAENHVTASGPTAENTSNDGTGLGGATLPSSSEESSMEHIKATADTKTSEQSAAALTDGESSSKPQTPAVVTPLADAAAAAEAAVAAGDSDDKDESPDNANEADATTPASASSSPSPSPKPPPALYKSRRFKGYLTVFLASIINFNAAKLSDAPIDVTAVPANNAQKAYAQAVAILSAIITGLLVLIHLDRYSPLEESLWRPAFSSPDAKFETILIMFLVIWWGVAAVVQTSVRGIAGDGKEQYNMYYSTWVCCWTCLWIAERKLVDKGYPTLKSFVTSWPYRAPGWIAIFCLDFFTLWWYVDLWNNTKQHPERVPEQLEEFYKPIPRSQYQWLLFVAAFTLLPSAIFIIVEILRGAAEEETTVQQATSPTNTRRNRAESTSSFKSSSSNTAAMVIRQQSQSRQPEKKSGETILEGFCLLCLTLGWIPSVIVATTPGGFASLVGNAYFSTWATTVFVLETFLWFIHDWRQGVHTALKEKEWEYRQHQRQVLEETLQKVHGRTSLTDEIDDDDEEEYDEPPSNVLGRGQYYNEDDDEEERSELHHEDYNDLSEYSDPEFDRRQGHNLITTPPKTRSLATKTPIVNLFGGGDDELPLEHHLRFDLGDDEDDAARELRLKQANEKAYFDDLDDILE